MYQTAINVVIGMAIANFGYQLVTSRNWARAFELTWFQAVAIGIFLLGMSN